MLVREFLTTLPEADAFDVREALDTFVKADALDVLVDFALPAAGFAVTTALDLDDLTAVDLVTCCFFAVTFLSAAAPGCGAASAVKIAIEATACNTRVRLNLNIALGLVRSCEMKHGRSVYKLKMSSNC